MLDRQAAIYTFSRAACIMSFVRLCMNDGDLPNCSFQTTRRASSRTDAARATKYYVPGPPAGKGARWRLGRLYAPLSSGLLLVRPGGPRTASRVLPLNNNGRGLKVEAHSSAPRPSHRSMSRYDKPSRRATTQTSLLRRRS